MSLRPAIALAALGLGCAAEPVPRVAGQSDPDGPRTLTADHTVQELLEGEAPTVKGSLLCTDQAGWTVYGWRVPTNNRRDTQGLPIGAPEVSAPVTSEGTYTLALPSGPRRFIAAVQDDTGRIAWSDPHARTFPLRHPLIRLSLDCDLTPTPAGDGSTVAMQGERPRSPQPERGPSPNGTPLAKTELGSTPARANAKELDHIQLGSRAHRTFLRRRYANDLPEEDLEMLMPVLMQLSDDPEAADRIVGRMKRVKHYRTEELPAADDKPIGLIEIPGIHGGHR